MAESVRDNALQRSRLEKEHARLMQFEGRTDLDVADMLTLSRQLAETEAALDGTQREAAQQRHRIDTNLLTLEFQPTGTEAGARISARPSATLARSWPQALPG